MPLGWKNKIKLETRLIAAIIVFSILGVVMFVWLVMKDFLS